MHRRQFLLTAGAAVAARGAASASYYEIVIAGKPVTRFYCGEEWDKPFLYPLRTVSGKVISRGWPLEQRDGDSTDHVWHRGIWWGHGLINGQDFWRELGRDKSSRLVAKTKPGMEVSRGIAEVTADLSMVTPKGETLGSVREQFTIRDSAQLRLIDAEIAVLADHGQALTFGDTDDGGFAFRLSEAFREDRSALLINSEGQRGTKAIWGKPAKWTDYSAEVEGQPCGVAMFDHPSNLRHPTRWHARGYSLNAANPFGLKSFTGDSAKDGSHTVAEGGKITFTYRVVIHEGNLEPGAIDRLYREWAR